MGNVHDTHFILAAKRGWVCPPLVEVPWPSGRVLDYDTEISSLSLRPVAGKLQPVHPAASGYLMLVRGRLGSKDRGMGSTLRMPCCRYSRAPIPCCPMTNKAMGSLFFTPPPLIPCLGCVSCTLLTYAYWGLDMWSPKSRAFHPHLNCNTFLSPPPQLQHVLVPWVTVLRDARPFCKMYIYLQYSIQAMLAFTG